MRCEVHSSDLDVFINSLKRVADDVRSVPDQKGKHTHTHTPAVWLSQFFRQNYSNLHLWTKAVIISFLPVGSSLVSATDKRARQMQPADYQIWSGHGPGAPGESLMLKWWNAFFSYFVRSNLTTFLQGYNDPEYRKRRAFISELACRYKQWVWDGVHLSFSRTHLMSLSPA